MSTRPIGILCSVCYGRCQNGENVPCARCKATGWALVLVWALAEVGSLKEPPV